MSNLVKWSGDWVVASRDGRRGFVLTEELKADLSQGPSLVLRTLRHWFISASLCNIKPSDRDQMASMGGEDISEGLQAAIRHPRRLQQIREIQGLRGDLYGLCSIVTTGLLLRDVEALDRDLVMASYSISGLEVLREKVQRPLTYEEVYEALVGVYERLSLTS